MLIDDLFKNYQVKFGRPVNNMTEKVVVFFGIMLIQLIDLVNFNLGYQQGVCGFIKDFLYLRMKEIKF